MIRIINMITKQSIQSSLNLKQNKFLIIWRFLIFKEQSMHKNGYPEHPAVIPIHTPEVSICTSVPSGCAVEVSIRTSEHSGRTHGITSRTSEYSGRTPEIFIRTNLQGLYYKWAQTVHFICTTVGKLMNYPVQCITS